MSDQPYSTGALIGEIDSAIAKTDRSTIRLAEEPGLVDCKAHPAHNDALKTLLFGQFVLLRCEKARLEQPVQKRDREPTERQLSRKEFVGWCAGVSTIIIGFFEGLRRLFGG